MKRATIILAVIALVVVVGVLLASKLRAADSGQKTQYKVAQVEVGMVKKTVSATGTLQPWRMIDIKSKAGGRVDVMKVDVGSVVKAGQDLAHIDPSDTQLQVDQAQADINSADARIQSSQLTWELQKKQSDLAVKQAQASLEAAWASLSAAKARAESSRLQKNVQPDLTRASIASAQASYDSALKQQHELERATQPQERAQAQSALDQAQANERNAKANLSRQQTLLAKGFVSQQVVDQAQATHEVAQAQVESARKKMDTLDAEQQAALDASKARVSQAKAQLDNAQAQKVDVKMREASYAESQASVRQAEQQVRNAERQYQLARANMANINIRRTDIAQANATRMRASAGLVNAKKTLDQTVVRSPTDGVVLQKYVEQGTIISSALSFAATGNNILQLGDTTRMYVDVQVDETDIANVNDGQKVDVIIEAYPNIPFEGRVIRIDPQAIVEQNVTSVHVRVEVDNSAPAFRLLKPGMNATCEFIVDQKDSVVVVPNEAIRTDDQGTYVEVGQGGTPAPPDPKTKEPAEPGTLVDVKVIRRAVQAGVEGNETTEIVDGLKEGETIVTQKIEPSPEQSGGAFGGGMPGMRGGGRR